MYLQSVIWPLFIQVKFILIFLQLSFSLLCFWFFFSSSWQAQQQHFLLLCVTSTPSLPHCLPPSPAASILPPFSAVCLQMKQAACQFFIFLGSKVASQLPGDGERGELGLAKGYICTMCLWKNSTEEAGREWKKKERKKDWKSWAGSAKRLHRCGVMEKALWGNIQYARVSSCMQSLQWCLSLSVSLFV